MTRDSSDRACSNNSLGHKCQKMVDRLYSREACNNEIRLIKQYAKCSLCSENVRVKVPFSAATHTDPLRSDCIWIRISQKITTFIVVPERNQLLSGAQLCLTHAAARIIYNYTVIMNTNTITMLKKQ